MPKCEICGRDLKNPKAKSHVNSEFHQNRLKKIGKDERMEIEKEEEHLHQKEVEFAIECAISSGCSTYEQVLKDLGGADPNLVKKLFDKKFGSMRDKSINKHGDILKKYVARRRSAELPLKFPAPNPMMSQWWFTLNSVSSLSDQVWKLSKDSPVAFLGTPTVGYHYAHCYEQASTILDADQDIIESLKLPNLASKHRYDVCDEVPSDLKSKFSVVLLDPPWYLSFVELFIGRANSLLGKSGFILCVLPSRLTRPGLIKERTELIKKLIESDFELLSLDSNAVQYRVPDFELIAYKDISDFSGRSWRYGDLLILKTNKNSKIELPKILKEEYSVFARNPQKLRFFMFDGKFDKNLTEIIEPVEGFSTSVSTRKFLKEEIALWGSNKKAVKVQDLDICKEILELWEKGRSENEVRKLLRSVSNIDSITSLFTHHLGLWKDGETTVRRRTTTELESRMKDILSDLASSPTNRCYDYSQDGFRLDFQRDRDRILWSHSLKRLASKTQLFPVKSDDQYRRRLTHTIEVMQIASTIAVAFGLDRFLTEAGAFGHDLGHAPFGHAGEEALNETLNEINVDIGGFNHYEHGVDVVRWIENVYQSVGSDGFPGLNLAFETVECIFKHTFFRNEEKSFAQSKLSKNTKHTDLRNDKSCSLEGQAVRIADKITYMISDLEDGIRMGVIKLQDLLNCKFFEHPPIDILPGDEESLYERFISQRRAILKVIMEDILNSTDMRLGHLLENGDIKEVIKNRRDYVISYSESLSYDISEIWKNLQEGILFKEESVMAANARAKKIVRDLLLLYLVAPHLVDLRFRKTHRRLKETEYMQWYLDKVGQEVIIPKSKLPYEYALRIEKETANDKFSISIEDIILSKDYVASLTDTKAVLEHRKYFGMMSE